MTMRQISQVYFERELYKIRVVQDVQRQTI